MNHFSYIIFIPPKQFFGVRGWGIKKYFDTSQNILEGNGVVFKNFTINNF